MASSPTISPERELMLRLVSVRAQRERDEQRISELTTVADFELFGKLLMHQRLFLLAGKRLTMIPGAEVPQGFLEMLAQTQERGLRRALLQESQTTTLARYVEAEGVPVVPLKGPLLSARLYGDPSLRQSVDIDFLVEPATFERAANALNRHGYAGFKPAGWFGRLPLFESTLRPEQPWLPPIDLHWRIHWNETEFSAGLVDRSRLGSDGIRTLAPEDELACVLAVYARDGLRGLRSACDVAAWWDVHHDTLDEPPLDRVVKAHPELATALAAAVRVTEGLVKVPPGRLLTRKRARYAERVAVRLTNWSQDGSDNEQVAIVTLVDGLLSPRRRKMDSVRRHIVPPAAAITRIYGLREDDRLGRALHRIRFASILGARFLPRYPRILWKIRGGQSLVGLPAFRPPQRGAGSSQNGSGAAAPDHALRAER